MNDQAPEGLSTVNIRTYRTSDLEYIINRHKALYETEYGFKPEFVHYVEKYVRLFDKNHDESNERIWIAEAGQEPVGVIAVVRADGTTAQLRWFLLEPWMRGRGVGRKLMNTALGFCAERGYRHIFLWTVSILDAARHLYRSSGFAITETKPNDSWAPGLTEERWDMRLD